MEDIRERLKRGDVVVGDGAWGTMLMERGLPAGAPPESYNLLHPEILVDIASTYLDAGAEIVTTNTFGASPMRLSAHGLDARADEINRNAVEAARRAAGRRAYVSASVGPSGRLLVPYGDADPAEMYAGFERQIRTLIDAGSDLICVETMTDLAEAKLAVRAARALSPTVPVVATMTFEETPRGFFTVMGTSVSQAVSGLQEAGADILGSNCGNGVEVMVGIAREFRSRTALPIAIQANAGLPVAVEGRLRYPETPEFFAARSRDLLAAGVRLIGGCCGTTPDHIRSLRKAVTDYLSDPRRQTG